MYENLPLIVTVDDYHEFRTIEHYIQLIDRNLKCDKIGFSAPLYVGVMYYKKITKKQIKDLLDKEEIELED